MNNILNDYIRNSHCTFDLEPWTEARRRDWFAALVPPQLAFVAVEGDAVLGYACSGRLRPKVGYNSSVETTVYIDRHHHGRGLGKALLSELLSALNGCEVHRAFAGIAQPNEASVALHERLGYRHIGTFGEVGTKFSQYHDVAWYQYDF